MAIIAKKAAVISLGCPKNTTDSEVMLGQLLESGYEIVNKAEGADVLLINTCAFLESARSEAYQQITECVELKTKGKVQKIIVAGCLPVYDKEKPLHDGRDKLLEKWPQIDAVIGPAEIYKLKEILEKPEQKVYVGNLKYDLLPASRVISTAAGSAYLKIADGCDNRCSFCTIPRLRGPYRSKKEEIVLAEAETLVKSGIKEIILIAQDTTAYGKDLSGRLELAGLIKKLSRLQGVEWIRIMYAYPSHITDELIEVMATEDKVCRYLDLPLQHIDDEVLRSMERETDEKQIREVINKLKKAMPDIALRTTFIVGYPGESAEQFEKLLKFVEEVKFARVGVFTYSREAGTSAASKREQVAEEVKNQRFNELMRLQNRISKEQNKMFVGKELKVLMDSAATGRTFRDAPEIDGIVSIDSAKNAPAPGDLIKVKITRSSDYDLGGKMVT